MFKVPQTIPQDLLLIQEFVDTPLPHSRNVVEDSDISSSGSEDEIVAVLTKSEDAKAPTEPSDSSSDLSSESESDSESNEVNERQAMPDFDEDEDPLPVSSSGNYFSTKNEMTQVEITAPEIEQVGPDERLEKVGEIMNIVDRVVIVRGLPLQYLNRASERALDSDTLLVFEDRKVLGYIYETFGPTMQPLYQIKFPETFILDPVRVIIGREVFHVPSRSKFVFVGQIRGLKGSDASNVHDEEPGDDELEFFSDDEAESAYRNRLKRRSGDSRHRSASSSRSATPNPSLMRDEELAFEDECFLSGDAYAEHGPYDVDYGSLSGLPPSSRPTPTAYDDPYADSYNSLDVTESQGALQSSIPRTESPSFEYGRPLRGRRRGNRGRGERGHRGHGRGRHAGQRHPAISAPVSPSPDQYTTYFQTHRQYDEYSPLYPEQHLPHPMALQNVHYGSEPQNYLQPFVQPHINPRFASAFGFSVYPPSSPGYTPSCPPDFPHGQYGISNNTADEWSVPAQDGSTANSQSETAQ